jgi:hypothetical protein
MKCFKYFILINYKIRMKLNLKSLNFKNVYNDTVMTICIIILIIVLFNFTHITKILSRQDNNKKELFQEIGIFTNPIATQSLNNILNGNDGNDGNNENNQNTSILYEYKNVNNNKPILTIGVVKTILNNIKDTNTEYINNTSNKEKIKNYLNTETGTTINSDNIQDGKFVFREYRDNPLDSEYLFMKTYLSKLIVNKLINRILELDFIVDVNTDEAKLMPYDIDTINQTIDNFIKNDIFADNYVEIFMGNGADGMSMIYNNINEIINNLLSNHSLPEYSQIITINYRL